MQKPSAVPNRSRKPRPVVCWETGETYPNLRAAAKAVGISGSGMIGVAARKGSMAGGFHWFYEGDPKPDASELKGSRKKPVVCYESGRVFESAAAAARAIGSKDNLPDIAEAARTGGMAGGYHWYYENSPKPAPGDLKGNKAVVCWETGTVFPNTQEAADWAGTTASGIYTAARCRTLSGGYHWYFDGKSKPQAVDPGPKKPRAVICVETGEVFPSAKQAATAVGLKWATSLKPALEHPHRTAGGYHWHYEGSPKPKESELKKPSKHAVVCWETGEVFDNAERAAAAVGLKNANSIRAALNGKRITAGGFHWCHLDQPRPDTSEFKRSNRKRPVACYETDEVFASADEAAAAVGLTSADSIRAAIRNHSRIGGHFWYRPDQPKPKESELKQTKQRARRKQSQ